MNSLAMTGLVVGGLAFLFKDQVSALFSVAETAPSDRKPEGGGPPGSPIPPPTSTPAPRSAPTATPAPRSAPTATPAPRSAPTATPDPRSPTTATPDPRSAPSDLVAPIPPPPSAAATTLQSIVFAVQLISGQRRLASADEWNFYYSQASGIPQTADLFTAGNRGEEITLFEYLARRGAAGLSGLTNLGRVR